MWQTPAELHSALNDLPVILVIAALAFDLLGAATKRDSLEAAGFWTLVGAGIGAPVALITGLLAADSIEHGGSVHLVMERHKTLAISATVLIVALAAWRIWRRRLHPQERSAHLTIVGVAALTIIWVAHLGGTIVYRFGGGVPTPVLEAALEERNAGHSHGAGEEHEHGKEPGATGAVSDSATEGEAHSHPPNTPAHEHE